MSQKELKVTIEPAWAGERLDVALSRQLPELSRALVQKLIKSGLVSSAAGAITVPRFPVKSQMSITVVLPEQEESLELTPTSFDFPILFEDDAMLVIAKPAGVVVHPAAGNPTGTVVNAFIGRYPHLAQELADGNTLRPGIVHRLDKDTSGCLVLAKSVQAQFQLGRAFANRQTGKTYLAITRGIPVKSSGELAGLIGRHPVNRQKMALVDRNGKPALTRYKVVASGEIDSIPVSLVKVVILTGRTHQIRVHLASIGIPVLGDALYGGDKRVPTGVERQLLHAWKLRLPHPITGELKEFVAPIPMDMQQIIDRLPVQAADLERD